MKKTAAAVLLLMTALPLAPSSYAQDKPPAATPSAPLPDWLAYKNPYVGEENDIGNAHRTSDEMALWAQQAAADVLSFGADDYAAKMESFKKYFAQQGWQMYTAYLKDSKIADTVTQNGYSVGAIVDRTPDIVSYGPLDGSFHWIIKMPITVSFFSTDASGHTRTGGSGKYTLFVDVVRVPQGGDNGVAINNWRVDGAQP